MTSSKLDDAPLQVQRATKAPSARTQLAATAIKPRAKQFDVYDTGTPGLILRVNPTGRKKWRFRYRDDKGKMGSQELGQFGEPPLMTVKAANQAAIAFKVNLKTFLAQRDAAPVVKATFKVISENWLKRVVDANALRSAPQIRSYLTRLIYPEWEDRPFEAIRRGDVTKLLDKVTDDRGPRAADYVLAIVRRIMQWHATRTENYTSPIIRGMARTKPAERRRKRILSDDEIRAVWSASGKLGVFGALTRILLLTAQRRTKVSTMKRSDVVDGVWIIATQAREKSNAEKLRLPKMALDILAGVPALDGNDYQFPASREGRRDGAGRDFGSYSAFGQGKEALDRLVAEILPDVPQWQLHDLRRTARSLMARADVRPDIAERVLGHAIAGVEGTYDRHSYEEQRALALEALATLIARILNPPAANVVSIKR